MGLLFVMMNVKMGAKRLFDEPLARKARLRCIQLHCRKVTSFCWGRISLAILACKGEQEGRVSILSSSMYHLGKAYRPRKTPSRMSVLAVAYTCLGGSVLVTSWRWMVSKASWMYGRCERAEKQNGSDFLRQSGGYIR